MGERPKHSVEIMPIGHTISVADGELLMPTAQALGYRWPNVCNGEAACGVCLLEIQEGLENASPIGRDEAVRLAFIRKAGKSGARLACQIRVFGPMRVLKRGVRAMGGPSGAPTDDGSE